VTDVLRASLRAFAITVDALSRSGTVPNPSARTWILACLSDSLPWSVFPGLLPEAENGQIIDVLVAGEDHDFEFRVAGFKAIAQASGREWWEALRLVNMVDDPVMLGRLTVAGVDPERLSFAAWCAAVYHLATDGADQKERFKFDSKLMAPPSMPEAFEAAQEDDFAAMVMMARNLPGMSG
jgi:hypothetical protein